MHIANPIYDVVFKYLMEDHKVATLFLSTITELEIIELEFLPQELSVNKEDIDKYGNEKVIQTGLNLSIYRLDFSAKVLLEDGTNKVIIIEVQKSKFAHENMRFRKYLGKQYMNENFFSWITDINGRSYKSGTPILPIYFLGEHIEGFDQVPIIKVSTIVKDRYSDKILQNKLHFIESLFHEGIIVNIPALKKKRRDDIEHLLSVFDQNNRLENHHIMNVQEVDFPEKFRPIIRRLQAAAQQKDVRDIMIIEDDFISEINDYEHRIAESEKLLKESLKKQEEAARNEEEAIRRQEEAVKRQEEAVKRQEEAVRLLIKLGVSKEEISAQLDIPIEELDKLMS